MDLNAAIAAERRRIADLVDSLSPAQLEVRSLCGAWSVREEAGHLLAAASPMARFPLRWSFRYPGRLTDLQVHGQDMRRPLGLPHGLDPDRLLISLDFLTGRRAGFSSRRRLAGLRLEATDLAWSWGAGAVLAGPAEALMMAAAGRPAALRDLDGPGVRVLASRIRQACSAP
jgi:hypothetical protein